MSDSVLLPFVVYAGTVGMIGLAASEVRRRGLALGVRRLAVLVAVVAACAAGAVLAGRDNSRGVLIGLLAAAVFGDEAHGFLFPALRREGRRR
jgi:hypothetical protein